MDKDKLKHYEQIENAILTLKMESIIEELKELYFYTKKEELFDVINKLEKMELD
jgi:hypothetical protein